jgi:hypothetical protein
MESETISFRGKSSDFKESNNMEIAFKNREMG